MTVSLLVGVDIGTQSVKSAVYEANGRCIAEAVAPLALHVEGHDLVEQDPLQFFTVACSTIASCIERSSIDPGQIAGVGVAGQMAGVLGIDAAGVPVTPYDSWLDSRCREDLADLDRECGDEMVALTGCPAMVAHAPKLRWLKRTQPGVFADVARFVMPSAFVAGHLCGLGADDAFIDWTHLHFSGLADAARGTWSDDLADVVGVPLAKLPRIVAPTDVVGRVTAKAARESGLAPGTPVVAGMGDTAAGALGAGLVQSGHVLDTAGTASVLAVSVPAFRADTETRTMIAMRGAVPGQWITLSYLAGGNVLRWLPQALAGSAAGSKTTLNDLLLEAEAIVDPTALPHFVPHLGGRILPAAPEMRGAWVGIGFEHRRGDLVRAVLESVAFEYAGYLARVEAMFPTLVPSDVRLIGGGSANRMWIELKSSVLGLPYHLLEGDHFTCWGAALAAGAGVGLVDDLVAGALTAASCTEQVQPDTRLATVYAERAAAYRVVLESVRGLECALSTRQEELV